jgi:hypothetical protein
MPVFAVDSPPRTLLVRALPDLVIDQVGHDPRSTYVERFWLAVLGPSAVWLLRRLAAGLEAEPAGFELDLDATARALGLGMRTGRQSPFLRTLARCCQFGATRLDAADGVLLARRKLPPLTRHQVGRLPEIMQAEHHAWLEDERLNAESDQRNRARRLALSLFELGEDVEATERQLLRWRFPPALARDATAWAWRRHREAAEAVAAVPVPDPPPAA